MESFRAPGPGMWELDRSHFPGGTTPIAQWLMMGLPEAMRGIFAQFGMPADTVDVAFVQGFMYTRLRPMLSPDRAATKLPPTVVLKIASRLHPAFRRRTKAAAATLRDRPWRAVVAEWLTTTRPELEARNLAFQAVALPELDDAALADHLEQLLAWCRETYRLHFHLHGFDLGPIGMLLADCQRWGISPPDVLPALTGASPSTTAPAQQLYELRQRLDALGVRPASLADVAAASPGTAALLEDYLRRRGSMLVTRYDIDGETLGERPATVLASILHAKPPRTDHRHAAEVAAALRAKVPPGELRRFDEGLDEARAAMDLRDDNGPYTAEWPVGLLRLALAELGQRLVARGRIPNHELTFELAPDEVVPLARSAGGPDAATLVERAAQRARQATLSPPARLGPIEPSPPLDALPAPTRTLVSAVQTLLRLVGLAEDSDESAADASAPDASATDASATDASAPGVRSPVAVTGGGRAPAATTLGGTGIGTVSYRGPARVATSPEGALDAIEPGEVLVVRFTTPAYNTVLSLAGAIVTSDGGPLCHAAVMARELGIAAVVGATGAMERIVDGDIVTVDPAEGVVTVLRAAAGTSDGGDLVLR